MIARRRQIREHYRAWSTSRLGAHILGGADDHDDNCWLTPVGFGELKQQQSIETLINTMAAHNIEARRVWKPMHLQPVFSDRKSTRLNSSHVARSYAVFCLTENTYI